jgi:hypothetical protein
MTIAYATFDILADFGSGLVSIGGDVLSVRSPIHANWGASACDPLTRCAPTGQFIFTLNNSEYNSASKLGYYSPANSNLRAGFGLETPVVLKISYGGVTKYKRFYISQITPVPGTVGTRQTDIVAADFMGRLAIQNITGLAVQVSKRTDQGLATLIGLLPTAPLATAYSVAPETQDYLFTDITDGTAFMTAVQHLALTDASYVFVKGDASGGETFCQETRQERQLRTSALTLNGTMTDLSMPINENQLLNDITASVFPGSVGAVAETLYQSPKEILVRAGATVTFQVNYTDPNQGQGSQSTVVLLPGSGVAPVSGTDYKVTATSGSGLNDAVASLTVGVVFNASYAVNTLTNLSTNFDVYVNPFNLRGQIIRLYNKQDVRIQDTAGNFQKYGDRPLSYPMYYQSNINFANDMANHWFGMWHLPAATPQYIEFIANNDTTQMAAAVSLDIGSRFTAIETVTGISADYCIVGIDMTIKEGAFLTVRYYVEPVGLLPYCILDDAYYDILDSPQCLVGF